MTDLGLRGTSFASDIPAIQQRLIANVEGLEKTGKTHFAAMTTPDPIAFMDLDRGCEGPLNRARAAGRRIVYSKYHFASLIIPNKEKETAERLRKVWSRFVVDYKGALQSKVRSIIIDTGYAAWELIKTARFGRFDRIPPILTAQVNAEFSRLLTMAQDYDKSVLWLHRLYPEWANKKSADGKEIGYKTGNLERRGFKDLAFDVQANIRLSKTPGGEFKATVVDSRLNNEVAGLSLTGEHATFVNLASMIYENDPEDWA